MDRQRFAQFALGAEESQQRTQEEASQYFRPRFRVGNSEETPPPSLPDGSPPMSDLEVQNKTSRIKDILDHMVDAELSVKARTALYSGQK